MPHWDQLWPHWIVAVPAILAVASSAHVLLTKRDPRAAALWLGLAWFAPLIGAALYFVAGINRMPRDAARRARVKRSGLPHDRAHSEAGAVLGTGAKLEGNQVHPLRSGDIAYPIMLQAIDEARDTILMCSFIFDNDRAGRQFQKALGAAVKRGVKVRVMIDAVGARYSFPSIVGALRRAGVQTVRFSRTYAPWRWRFANLRNHRKIMVIDGCLGFTGGMNIREECILALETTTPTQDLHFQVKGPIVAELQRTLVEDWEFATGEALDGARYFPPLAKAGDIPVRAISDGPDSVEDPILWTRLAAIARARTQIRIATPYFVPDSSMITALCVAASNGVNVEILLPAKSNLKVVQWASTNALLQLLERGCQVLRSAEPFDHMKLMLVDDGWAQIGSANWDARSFRLNFEFDLECWSDDFVGQLNQVFESKSEASQHLTLLQINSRSLPARLRDGLASVIAPYL